MYVFISWISSSSPAFLVLFLLGLILMARRDPRNTPLPRASPLHYTFWSRGDRAGKFFSSLSLRLRASANTHVCSRVRKVEIQFVLRSGFLKGLTPTKIVISGTDVWKERRTGQIARQDREKKRAIDGLREEGEGAAGGFLLGPIKKPVSSSVSKSLLWHSRQLRKHLKAPEKPDNTSLVECRVPLGGRRDFAPCQRDTRRSPCVAISALSYVLNIECPSRAKPRVQSRRDIPESKKFLPWFPALSFSQKAEISSR